jgi:D-sedoheptulose 7-phosphate isomerase
MTRDARTAPGAYLRTSAETMGRVEAACLPDIEAAAAVMTDALRGGGKLLICGNGGSAADAQHLATEFVSTLTVDNRRPSIPAIALTTDTSVLTAIANDFGLEGIFSRQVEALGRPGDVLIAISTSGDSANVVQAAVEAARRGLEVVALTGASGGALAGDADVCIRVPSTVTAHIQECHLAIEHLLASLVEDALHPRRPA